MLLLLAEVKARALLITASDSFKGSPENLFEMVAAPTFPEELTVSSRGAATSAEPPALVPWQSVMHFARQTVGAQSTMDNFAFDSPLLFVAALTDLSK